MYASSAFMRASPSGNGFPSRDSRCTSSHIAQQRDLLHLDLDFIASPQSKSLGVETFCYGVFGSTVLAEGGGVIVCAAT
jgi:hypothetical protein